MQLEIFALWDRGESDPGDVLRVVAENGKLLKDKADLAVGLDQSREIQRPLPALGAVIVEEGDDAHIASRVAGDEARGRVEDLIGMRRDPPLLPKMANIEETAIGDDRAHEPGESQQNDQT